MERKSRGRVGKSRRGEREIGGDDKRGVVGGAGEGDAGFESECKRGRRSGGV